MSVDENGFYSILHLFNQLGFDPVALIGTLGPFDTKVFFITFSLTFYGKNLFLHVRAYQFF